MEKAGIFLIGKTEQYEKIKEILSTVHDLSIVDWTDNILRGIFKIKLNPVNIILIDSDIIVRTDPRLAKGFLAHFPDKFVIIYNFPENNVELLSKIKEMGYKNILFKTDSIIDGIKKILGSKLPGSRKKEIIYPDIDVRLINPVIEAIEESIKELFGIKINKGTLFVLDLPFTTMGVGAIIDFYDHFTGKILLDMMKRTAKFLAEKFLHEEIKEFNQLVIDSISEILNIIAGKITTKIQHYGSTRITPPKVITENIVSDTIEHKKLMVVPLGIEKDIINVNFFIM